jgi:hypothetical protein
MTEQLTRDEILIKARKASIIVRQEQARQRNEIKELEKQVKKKHDEEYLEFLKLSLCNLKEEKQETEDMDINYHSSANLIFI